MKNSSGARRLLANPLVWVALLVSATLGAVLTFAYVAAFVNPIGELHDVKVAVINLDVPTEVAGQTIDVGDQFVETLASADTGGRIEVVTMTSEREATDAIERNEIIGAIVVPQDVSSTIAAIATSVGDHDPAVINLLRNDGSGTLQPAVFNEFTTTAITRLSDTVSAQLTSTIDSLGATVRATNVGALAQPVTSKVTDVLALGDTGGRGLPPFYVAVMTTLTGVLSAAALHVITGALMGVDHLEFLGRKRTIGSIQASPWDRWSVEAVVSAPIALIAGASITLMTVGVLNAQVDKPWTVFALCSAAVLAIMWFTQVFLTAFGLVGNIVVLFVTTIFGVPSARGVYPVEALPGFFAELGNVLPLRWLTDGLRSAFYYDAAGAAGLSGAWRAIVIYGIGSVVLGAVLAKVATRRAGVAPTLNDEPDTPEAAIA